MRRVPLAALVAATVVGAILPVSASAQTCPANIPHLTGTWEVLPYQMPINPISANLLPNGKVLIVAGSENDAKNNARGAESYRAAVWDPNGTTENSIAAQNVTYDIFCSAVAALPDGRSLVVGGTSDYTFTGEARASFFDWQSGSFAQSQNMAQGRWYGSAIELGDGSVMAMSGLTQTGATSTTVEIYDLRNVGAGWKSPTSVPFTPPLYPRITPLPNGNVFYTGQGSGGSNANSWFFNPANGSWTASATTTANRTYGASVLLPLLPPNYTPRVMNFGGGPNPARSSTEIIDLSATSPAWTPGPNMSTGRIQMHAVILPNGKVLAEGGSVNNEAPNTPGKTADLYDPVINSFSSAGTAAYSRLYHSAALLLPDARVASMGSNPGARGSYEPAIEIYTPPYLFDANDQLITAGRPSITAISPSSGVMSYNTLFAVSYTSTKPIGSAVLVRPGSSTHSFEMEQRLIGLCGPAPQPACTGDNNSLNLTTPANGNVAPPGYYMLFLLNNAGVPSTAQFIQLIPPLYSAVPPVGSISSPPPSVPPITAGGTVSFGTTSTAARYSWIFPGGTPATSTAQNPGPVTFAAAGIYTASLTLIDSSGNSDPHPPTRTITVVPTTPDFSISVGPTAVEVTPGGTATFNVTVTSQSGFTGPVTLSVGSESGFPIGITAQGFSPATINGSGSSTLTMTTTTSTTPWALSLTITGTSGSLTHTAATTLLVNLAPPTQVSAVAGDTQVALSWPASVGATGYHVKRANVSQGPYLTRACPSSTSYVDPGLTDGTTYFYVVSAAFTGNPNAGGESANSVEASAIPRPPGPPTPTGLVATAGNGQVTLTWNASSGATSYQVKRATVSGGPYTVIASPTSSSYTNAGLSNGTTYYYVVSAVNLGGESADSVEASATPGAQVPPTPTGIAATAGNGQVTLTWNASSGATSYQVKRATVSGGPYTVIASPTSPSYTNAGLSNGTTYYYVVSAVNLGGESTNSTQVSATPTTVPPTGLVAAYAFNEGAGTTVADASGNNNNGTLGGGVNWSTQGKYGNALVFNGSNALVTIADSASLHLTTGMTLEAWVNPSTVSSAWRDVVYKGNDNYFLEATSTNGGKPWAGGTFGETSGTAPLAANTWTHLAVTYDKVTLRLYVNGVQVSSLARTVNIATSTNPLQIGGDSIYGQYFQGSIDEVRIYNRALAQAEIQTDMNTAVGGGDTVAPTAAITIPTSAATFTTSSSPLTLGGTAADNVGVTQVSWTSNRGGSGTAAGTTSWSVSGIVLQPGTNVLTVTARDAANNASTATLTVTYTATDTTAPTVAITTPTAAAAFFTNSSPLTLAGTAADNVGVTQVSWTSNRGGSGTAAGTTAWSVSGIVLQTGTNALTVTASDAAGNTGTATLTVTYDTTAPTASITAPSGGATVSGTTTLTATASDNIGVVGVQFLLDGAALGAEQPGPAFSLSWATNSVANGVHTLSARARDAAGNTGLAATVSVTVSNTQAPGLIAAYSFNEGTGTTVADVSGNNNNGTLGGGVTWSTQGKYGNALVFNGSNALVTIADSASLHLTTGMTLEAWVNPSTVSSAWRDVVYKGNDNYFLEGTSTNGGVPWAGGTFGETAGTAPLATNTWTHLAVTYDRVTLRLYVNGVQVSSLARTVNIATSTNPLQIGGDSIYGQYFQGSIDDVRVYNRALSQTEIQSDMSTPVQ